MKKIILCIGLLAFQPLGIACYTASYSNVSLHLTNATNDEIYVSCPGMGDHTLIKSETYSFTNSYGCKSIPSFNCTYTDKSNNHSGTLAFNTDSCDNPSASTSPNVGGSSPAAFACSPPSHGSSGTSYCNGYQEKGQPNYTMDAYYTFNQPILHTLRWNNVKMSLVKGQIAADKLAANLVHVTNEKANAIYDGNTMQILLYAYDNPYPSSTCN